MNSSGTEENSRNSVQKYFSSRTTRGLGLVSTNLWKSGTSCPTWTLWQGDLLGGGGKGCECCLSRVCWRIWLFPIEFSWKNWLSMVWMGVAWAGWKPGWMAEPRLGSVPPPREQGTGGNGLKGCQRRFGLDIRKGFIPWKGGQALEQDGTLWMWVRGGLGSAGWAPGLHDLGDLSWISVDHWTAWCRNSRCCLEHKEVEMNVMRSW